MERVVAQRSSTYLHVTFCDVEGGNASVGDTASEDTTKHALGVVAGVVGDGAEVPGGQGMGIARDGSDTSTTYLASHFPEGAR